jgi:hypothetical protein
MRGTLLYLVLASSREMVWFWLVYVSLGDLVQIDQNSQILTLAQNVGPFSADVNFKYELRNFNSYREKC